MEFIDQIATNTITINSVSKSRLGRAERCPQEAYRALRDTTREIDNARMLDLGILAHEVARQKVSAIANRDYDIQLITERYPLDVVFEVQQSISTRVNFEELLKDQTIISIEESFSIEVSDISEHFRIIAKPDLTTYREIRDSNFVNVYDWKSGFAMKTEVDTEALIYAYSAYKKYGLPVILTRVNLRTGKIWAHEFSIQAIQEIEPMILSKIRKYKEEMESDIMPEFKPGPHCQNCKYITTCDGRKYINTLRHKFKVSIWAKELAKKYDNEIKAAAKELLDNTVPAEEGSVVLLPFLEGRYGATAETSKSFQLATRKIKKDTLIPLLAGAGRLEDFMDNLSLKIDQNLSNILSEEFKLPMKEVVRTTISLKVQEEEE